VNNLRITILLALALGIPLVTATAQTSAVVQTGPCPRFAAGSTVTNPPALFSKNGVLKVNLSYQTEQDAQGRTLYCFTTPSGTESPTLHVKPGDHLMINVKNNLPVPTSASEMQMATNAASICGATKMNTSSVNVHYHGTNTSPACHQDEVVHTLINPGQTFSYNVAFPSDEPPGLYWYHPHVHGISEPAVLGGASGVIVVDGIESVQRATLGLPHRILVVRDQPVAGNPTPGGAVPAWDLTLNYVPISYPALTPAVITMEPGKKQFWRVVNAAADTILDLQVNYDGTAQPLQLVALDGVPVGSQDGTSQGKLIPVTNLRLPPAARMEFILTAPSASVKIARLITQAINTGPDGDNDTRRVLANIEPAASIAIGADAMISAKASAPGPQRFAGLADAAVTAKRALYFSENSNQTKFFITVDGQKPVVFSPEKKKTTNSISTRSISW
jgi:FtsP/CotA-like multicopper oxidase with cupredoxin domain